MIKIAITGVESTGKSTLARDLTNHFKGIYVEEFARTFLESSGGSYTYNDIQTIAKIQNNRIEKAASQKAEFLFADTELLVTYIWCTHKYGKVHPWIEDQLRKQTFDLYLLPAVDLPWTPDPLRESPAELNVLFSKYQDLLEQLNFPYAVISGRGDERFQQACRAVEACKK